MKFRTSSRNLERAMLFCVNFFWQFVFMNLQLRRYGRFGAEVTVGDR